MRVLVCGGRGFGEMPKHVLFGTPSYIDASRAVEHERALLRSTLDGLDLKPTAIIEGGASGADRMARAWAKSVGIRTETFKADWYPNGFGRLDKSAGPIRNQRMLDEGKPDIVVAFPGGRGTADMVRRAEAAGVKVVRVG